METETLKATWSEARFLTPGASIRANGTRITCTVSFWRSSGLAKTSSGYDGGNP